MKTTLLLISIVLSTMSFLQAQEIYPKGIYMSLNEINFKTPSDTSLLLVTKKSKSEILLKGGNDYSIESPTKKVPKVKIKKEIVAYSDGEQLYVNCYLQECQPGFARVIQAEDNTLVFIGAASDSRAYTMGLFGLIGSTIVVNERYRYRLDLKSGVKQVENKVSDF